MVDAGTHKSSPTGMRPGWLLDPNHACPSQRQKFADLLELDELVDGEANRIRLDRRHRHCSSALGRRCRPCRLCGALRCRACALARGARAGTRRLHDHAAPDRRAGAGATAFRVRPTRPIGSCGSAASICAFLHTPSSKQEASPFFAQGVDGDSPWLAACRRWACTGMHPLPRTVEGGRCSAGPARVRQRPHSSLSAFGRLCSADPCKYSDDGTCDAPSSFCPIGDYNDCGTEPVTTPARNPHSALAPSVPHT